MIIRQAFTSQYRTQTVYRVFEIRLRGRFGAILKGIKILMNIFSAQFQGGTVKIQGQSCQMTAIARNGIVAFALNGHAAVETVIERFQQWRATVLYNRAIFIFSK